MIAWLNRVTGTVTMYRLVLVALGATTALAFILSFVGQVPFEALEGLVSLVVAVGATLLVSVIVGLIVRRPAHAESAVITGLILFLLFTPTLDPTQLAGTALAGALAAISKHVLAVRGRHIFNPAAIGAAIVFLTGLNLATWWVATPALLPIVALGALVILFRTRRLTIGVVFVVVAVAVVAGRIAITGTPLPDAVLTAFTSYPIVFLAGFMLSEPLTLPPRRWQQVIVAGVVGVVFGIPYSFGPVFASPELALLLGNLIAFAFGQRRAITLTFVGKTEIGPGTWELAFQPSRPVRFSPGQYMELTLPHRADFRGQRRYFSISSAPTTDGPITFALTVPEKSSSFKRALLALEPGAVIHATGVGGDFALPRDSTAPVLLVAGGIGITPFASQLAHHRDRDVTVVYSTRATGDVPYAAVLERSGARVVLFSPEQPSPLPTGWHWAGPDRVTGEVLTTLVPDAASRRTYISGPPALVTDLRRSLRAAGARRIHTDYFSGY